MNKFIYTARKAKYALNDDNMKFAKYTACYRNQEANGMKVKPIKLESYPG
jgi:hypothetical protein